jgi:uncharacterized membrane protein YfcA
MTFWLWYAALGGVGGILAGLMGVGGGIVIVPALVWLFTAQGFSPDHIQHMAVGTSLATIVFTSLSSTRAHHGKEAVTWRTVVQIAPGIVAGTLAGAWVASLISTRFLRGIFVVFIYYVSVQMLAKITVRPHRQLPGTAGMFGTGGVIGVVSSLVGIGGGSMSVPFMLWCNVPMRTAIGTSAAIGLPIALAGTVGNILTGWGVPALPSLSLGFVYLPALLGISLVSMFTAPLGARLAHALPVALLRSGFAVFLLIVGTKMLIGLL